MFSREEALAPQCLTPRQLVADMRDMLDRTLACGLAFKPGINELEKAGLTGVASLKVRPPRIGEWRKLCREMVRCQCAYQVNSNKTLPIDSKQYCKKYFIASWTLFQSALTTR